MPRSPLGAIGCAIMLLVGLIAACFIVVTPVVLVLAWIFEW